MSLYGENRDISFMRHINRELLNNIIEQKCGYYKLSLSQTDSNMYGESNGKKTYNDPVLINCLVDRGEQTANSGDEGVDITRDVKFRFLRDDLAGIDISTELNQDGKGFTYNIVPEIGDVILWNEDYYEIDTIVENQLFVGKDPSYSYSDNTNNFGNSLSIIVSTHYTRPEKLGIVQERL